MTTKSEKFSISAILMKDSTEKDKTRTNAATGNGENKLLFF